MCRFILDKSILKTTFRLLCTGRLIYIAGFFETGSEIAEMTNNSRIIWRRINALWHRVFTISITGLPNNLGTTAEQAVIKFIWKEIRRSDFLYIFL